MFFEKRTQSSVKHRRLKYIALLAMRCPYFSARAPVCETLRSLGVSRGRAGTEAYDRRGRQFFQYARRYTNH